MATKDDTAAQIAALQATIADQQDQLDYLFRQFGPVRWQHVLKHRKEAGVTKAPFNRGDFIYRPKPSEEKQQ
jgi:hypothetical protein